MMRVLHILDAGRPGDAAVYLTEYVRHASADLELLLWTPQHRSRTGSAGDVDDLAGASRPPAVLLAAGLTRALRLLPLEAIGERWDGLAGIRRLARAMVHERIDLVHAHDPRSARAGGVAAMWARVPVMFRSEYESVAPGALTGMDGVLDALALRATARVLCVCEEVRRSRAVRRPWAADRFVTVPGGVSGPHVVRDGDATRTALGIGPDEQVVLAAGPLIATEGHLVLFAAFRHVAAARPGVRLVVAGEGPLRPELEREAALAGLGPAVTVVDRDPRELIGIADLFAFAGLRAGLPPLLLEAMRAARPVVAARTGGVPEAVVDGATGWLVPPGDAHSAAEAMLHLLGDPGRARAMGAAGRARWERDFTGGRMVADTERLYQAARAHSAHRAPARAVDDVRAARQTP